MNQDQATRILLRYGGMLSLAAAALHAAVIDTHLEEWWGYGLFFILASIGQGLYGLILLAMPLHPQWPPETWARFKTRLFWLGIHLNLMVIALYAITRTTGIPILGPQAGQVEPVGAFDLVTKGIEAALASCLLLLVALDKNPKTTTKRAPEAHTTPG